MLKKENDNLLTQISDTDKVKDNYNKLEQLIKYAKKMGLEILLEVNTKQEFDKSITRDIDILGINNRYLNTLQLDMQTTNRILREEFKINKPIISESGILTSEDIKMIGKSGVNGFLIGTSIMKADDIDKKIRELTSVKKQAASKVNEQSIPKELKEKLDNLEIQPSLLSKKINKRDSLLNKEV